ncbi:CRP-like cAMP-binding protein [Dyadobacter jejuensis]|uniref:CRP-like cAMP-binding protein n=2 Tax=Dyadobacter jejuensis TaxID=1082580 RepID=A0A316APP0_9BACT|nr:CRP-like cAMP-binding protein [Dyadobacter jejuensis]
MRENTAEILELANYTVLTATNGKEGVQMAQESSPDLIICDIMMPELDGYGVLHLLGKDDTTTGIPFVFLTAKVEKDDYRKGMTMGADDYLTKPYDDIELLNAVEMRLQKSERLKKKFERTADGLDEFIQEAKSLDLIAKLAEGKKVKTLKKKETIYTEGSFPSNIFFLQKGKVKAYKSNDYGKEFITDLYKEGDFFGYLDLLQGNPYQETAITFENTEVAIIPKEDFFNLLQGNRDVATKFIKMLSNEIKDREERLLQLAYNSVRKRVAQALVVLVQRYQDDKNKLFSISITREDIAAMAGTATETVIRTLSDFKEEKLVDMKGSLITVLEYDKLLRLRN